MGFTVYSIFIIPLFSTHLFPHCLMLAFSFQSMSQIHTHTHISFINSIKKNKTFQFAHRNLYDVSYSSNSKSSLFQHNQNQNQQAMPPAPIQADMNHCQPDFELELEPHLIEDQRLVGQSSASVTIERLRLQPDACNSPPPPTNNSVLCPVAVAAAAAAAARAQLPTNIYISVSLANGVPNHCEASPVAVAAAATLQAAELQVHERCYPDLLDIGLSSFATLPRRCRRAGELGSPYDNMGPRVTATGSSTFSLVEQPEPCIAVAAPLIQPPPEFVSL